MTGLGLRKALWSGVKWGIFLYLVEAMLHASNPHPLTSRDALLSAAIGLVAGTWAHLWANRGSRPQVQATEVANNRKL
jgi:hypothetical protein